jgi:hypothetical protein
MAPRRRRGPGRVTTLHQGPSVDITVTDINSPKITHQFGRPSTYSLAPRELAAHIKDLRRQGWQSWEVRARFDMEWAA